MLEELRLFKELRGSFPGVSDLEIVEYIEDELGVKCWELREGVSMGIDPLVGHGEGRIDKRFASALALARRAKEKDRVHNNSTAISRGKPCQDYITPFKSDAHPYTLERYKRAIAASEKLAQANAVKNGGNQTFKPAK